MPENEVLSLVRDLSKKVDHIRDEMVTKDEFNRLTDEFRKTDEEVNSTKVKVEHHDKVISTGGKIMGAIGGAILVSLLGYLASCGHSSVKGPSVYTTTPIIEKVIVGQKQ